MQGQVDARALAASLRRIADQRDPSLSGSLHRVIDACVQLFSVSGSGLMIADEQSVLRYAVASDGPGRMLEQAQLRTGQGPCIDAFVHDRVNLAADLSTDERYPLVAPIVVPLGVRSVLGVPVRLSGLPVGSLDVYVGDPRDWDESEQRALVRYGGVVEAMLEAALAADRAGELAAQLHYALDYRVPIERGIGYLMARDGLDHAEAFNRLRAAARRSRRKIGAVAEDLLSTGRLPEESR